jgi:hypothetical protein
MLRILERIKILLKSLKEAEKNQQTILLGGHGSIKGGGFGILCTVVNGKLQREF